MADRREIRLAELKSFIDDKQKQIGEIVENNYIKPEQFEALVQQQCSGRVAQTAELIANQIALVDTQGNLERIEGFFKVISTMEKWYNELFLWATTEGSEGRFLDEIAEAELLLRKEQFFQEIYAARTAQELAAQEALISQAQGNISLTICGGTAPRRTTLSRLRRSVSQFNHLCDSTMRTLGLSTPVVPFSSNAPSDVLCVYEGFRTDVAKVSVSPGTNRRANVSVLAGDESVLASFPDVSSDTNWDEVLFPGFSCRSQSGGVFGTSADNELASGTFDLGPRYSIAGFEKADAEEIQSHVQNADRLVRRKVIRCVRRFGDLTFSIPQRADACGVPTQF